MAFSAGVFSRLYNWVTDRNNSVKITASRMDAEFDGIATGLSNCVLKDGTQTITADLPLNGHKLTGVGVATAGTDALNRDSGDARYVPFGTAYSLTAPQQVQTRTNLGLGDAAVKNTGTTAGTLAAGDDSRFTSIAATAAAALVKTANLSDLASAPTARTNLGLGGAAVLSVGTTTGTVMAGDDARANGAVRFDTAQSLTTGQQSQALSNIGLSLPLIPGGRLTPQTGTPIVTADVSNAASVYYTIHTHGYVPVNGLLRAFTEISCLLSDATKSPAAAIANSNYDLFVWDDAGTLRLSRGPVWTTDTGRGTGSGTTELQRSASVWTNKFAITNGPGAGLGTYVGSIRTNGTSTVDFKFGAAAIGGSAASFNVWNAYNRTQFAALVQDSTSSWTYATATWRAANASNATRISAINGVTEDHTSAYYRCTTRAGSGSGGGHVGIGLNSTSALAARSTEGLLYSGTGGAGGNAIAEFMGSMGLGWNYLQALEYADSGQTQTVSGAQVEGQCSALSAIWRG